MPMMIRRTEDNSRRKFGQMRRPAAVLSKNGGNKSQICLPPSLFVKSSFHGRYIQTSVFQKILKSSSVTETKIGFKPRQFAGRWLHSSSSVLVAAGHQGKKERETEGLYNSEEG